MSCTCSQYTAIDHLCTPNSPTWKNCPQFLRYVEHMIRINSSHTSKLLIKTHTISVRTICDHSTDLQSIFSTDVYAINYILSSMRHKELDNNIEHQLDIKYYKTLIDNLEFDELRENLYKLPRSQLNLLRRKFRGLFAGFVEEALGNYDTFIDTFIKKASTHAKLYKHVSFGSNMSLHPNLLPNEGSVK